jgi:hypothetical protein
MQLLQKHGDNAGLWHEQQTIPVSRDENTRDNQ